MCLRFIDNLADGFFWYSRKKYKFNTLMEGVPELRERDISFGLNVVIYCSVTIPLCLAGIVLALLATALGFGTVIRAVTGILCIFFGVVFGVEALLKIPLIKWQRKLNGQKIGVAAMVLDIILGVSCLALIVLSVIMMLARI